MEYSFPHYLLAKQTIDDRALNAHVLDALRAHLPQGQLRVIEAGAGMGNMLARLVSWKVLTRAEYVHVDSMAENIRFAENLSATVVRLDGGSVARRVAEFVREKHITQVVFGRSATKGLRKHFYLSAIHKFLRDAPPVDVHIVTQEPK